MEICTISYSNELKFIIAFDCLYFCCLLKLWVLITSALHVRLFPLGEHKDSPSRYLGGLFLCIRSKFDPELVWLNGEIPVVFNCGQKIASISGRHIE